jgi:hypothetical protein
MEEKKITVQLDGGDIVELTKNEYALMLTSIASDILNPNSKISEPMNLTIKYQ